MEKTDGRVKSGGLWRTEYPRAAKDRKYTVIIRHERGGEVAERLVVNIKRASGQLRRHPGIKSPLLGQQVNIPDLRTWEIADYPRVLIYIEREKYVDIVRLLVQRQDLSAILDAP